MHKSFIPYLQHILDECNYITSVITEDVAMYQFLSDETLKMLPEVCPLLERQQRKFLLM